jgi:DNA-binding MarR family transcriptional regulator
MSENVDHTSLADTAISVAAHLEAELEEALLEHRLTRPSFLVLDALDRAEGGSLGQRDLVGRVRRTSGTMSVRLGRLERAHLIEREPDPENRRSVTVRITERGRSLVAAARPTYAERAARLAEGVPAADAPGLAAHLHDWLAFFDPGEHEAPRLGVAVAGAAAAKRMRRAVGLPDVAGVIVLRVARESAAQAGGVSRGDLIIEAAGSPIRSIGDLERAVQRSTGSITLNVLRGVDPLELEVSFAPSPSTQSPSPH